MLKKNALRRIFTATLALVIVCLCYFFPDNKNIGNIKQTTNYIDVNNIPIYLINKDDYVVKTRIVSNNTTTLDQAKYLIESLIIDGPNSSNLPANLKPIIPKNTKILSLFLENNLLKVNFSKEFLNIDAQLEEKMIESLVYTLTEIPKIKEIMLFVEDVKLNSLPQTNIILPSILTRDIGINKVYDLTSFKDICKTTIYYIGKEADLIYYVPVTKIDNNKNNKVEIIIEELKSSPTYETNLLSYLTSSVELLNYEILENTINLTFNNEIFANFKDKDILEEVKYSIALSLKDSLNVSNVNFVVDGNIINVFKEN